MVPALRPASLLSPLSPACVFDLEIDCGRGGASATAAGASSCLSQHVDGAAGAVEALQALCYHNDAGDDSATAAFARKVDGTIERRWAPALPTGRPIYHPAPKVLLLRRTSTVCSPRRLTNGKLETAKNLISYTPPLPVL
jgi:hypothetical protein